MNFLDNTFFGTLIAGILLSCFGIMLYKKQKGIDLDYKNNQVTSELGSILFASVDLAFEKFNIQLNIHDESNLNAKTIQLLSEKINEKSGNNLNNIATKEINTIWELINTNFYNLGSNLRLRNLHIIEMENLQKALGFFNFYILTIPVLPTLDKATLRTVKSEFKQRYVDVKDILQKIIKN